MTNNGIQYTNCKLDTLHFLFKPKFEEDYILFNDKKFYILKQLKSNNKVFHYFGSYNTKPYHIIYQPDPYSLWLIPVNWHKRHYTSGTFWFITENKKLKINCYVTNY